MFLNLLNHGFLLLFYCFLDIISKGLGVKEFATLPTTG